MINHYDSGYLMLSNNTTDTLTKRLEVPVSYNRYAGSNKNIKSEK